MLTKALQIIQKQIEKKESEKLSKEIKVILKEPCGNCGTEKHNNRNKQLTQQAQ